MLSGMTLPDGDGESNPPGPDSAWNGPQQSSGSAGQAGGHPSPPPGQQPQQPGPPLPWLTGPGQQPGYGPVPPGGGYPPVGPPGPQAPFNTLAIVALVVAVICLPPAGSVLGVVAMNQIRKNGQRGRGVAIAAIIAGVLMTLLTVLVAVVGFFAYQGIQAKQRAEEKLRQRAQQGQQLPGSRFPGGPGGNPMPEPMRFRAGECLTVGGRTEPFTRDKVVPCTQAHRAEIFAVVSAPGGPIPPLNAKPNPTCMDAFKGMPKSTQRKIGRALIATLGPTPAEQPGKIEWYCGFLSESKEFTSSQVGD